MPPTSTQNSPFLSPRSSHLKNALRREFNCVLASVDYTNCALINHLLLDVSIPEQRSKLIDGNPRSDTCSFHVYQAFDDSSFDCTNILVVSFIFVFYSILITLKNGRFFWCCFYSSFQRSFYADNFFTGDSIIQ